MSPALPPVIAIDGPSASGKGTVAQYVARELAFHYLDSGALYRVVALVSIERGVDLDDEVGVSAIALNLKVEFVEDAVRVGAWSVTEAIREERISDGASRVAALPGVRAALLARQRGFRREPGLVAEGRDMGSVVFPDAVLKIFLTASVEERAQRRYKQLIDKGLGANMSALLQDICARDARDSARSVAPLRMSGDAIEIDTTGITVAQAAAKIISCYRQVPQRAP